MHIVIISGFYYPFTIPPVNCFKPFMMELSKLNDVEIVCPVSSISYKSDLLMDNIKINFINSISNNLLAEVKSDNTRNNKRIHNKIRFFIYRFSRYIKALVSNKPYETDLINPYVNKLEESNGKYHIDLIISISSHFYCHIAALKFKLKEPYIKWITYTTDPFSYNETNPIEKRKLKFAIAVEQKVYNNCDYCFVTEELYPNIIHDFKIPFKKVTKFPFLIYDNVLKLYGYESESINAVYAGYLYYKIRNPQILLNVFSLIPYITTVRNKLKQA